MLEDKNYPKLSVKSDKDKNYDYLLKMDLYKLFMENETTAFISIFMVSNSNKMFSYIFFCIWQ